MDTEGTRLARIIKENNLTQTSLSERIGVNRSYVSNLVNGRVPITTSILTSLIKCFPNLNIHWLVTGVGPKDLVLDEGALEKMEEPFAPYGRVGDDVEPFEMLRIWKEGFEARVRALEEEFEARVRALEEEVMELKGGK